METEPSEKELVDVLSDKFLEEVLSKKLPHELLQGLVEKISKRLLEEESEEEEYEEESEESSGEETELSSSDDSESDLIEGETDPIKVLKWIGKIIKTSHVPHIAMGPTVREISWFKASGVLFDDMDNINKDKLLSLCKASGFGLGMENVFDVNHRLSFETRDVEVDFSPDDDTNIREGITSLLMNSRYRISFDKMNVYPTKGFFNNHKDTMRSSDNKYEQHVATLVVFLPTKFEGGELIMTEYVKGNKTQYLESVKGTQWKVFFRNRTHRVHEVKEGLRISLTYNVFEDIRGEPVTTDVETRLIGIIEQYKDLLSGRSLAYVFEHLYFESTGGSGIHNLSLIHI